MNRPASWLAAALLAVPIGAQEQSTEPSPAAATLLQQLQDEQQQLYEDWLEARRAAAKNPPEPDANGMVPAIAMRPDYSGLRARYLAAAADFEGEDAVGFLVAALRTSNAPQQYQEIFSTLLDDHIGSPQWGQLGSMLPGIDRMAGEEFGAALRTRLAEGCKNPRLLGWLAFAQQQKTLRESAPDSEAFAEAKATVAAAVAAADDQRLRGTFEQLVTEQEKFGIGMVAPDIVGVDLDGVAFKLSDYKGKVLFVDFWGDW